MDTVPLPKHPSHVYLPAPLVETSAGLLGVRVCCQEFEFTGWTCDNEARRYTYGLRCEGLDIEYQGTTDGPVNIQSTLMHFLQMLHLSSEYCRPHMFNPGVLTWAVEHSSELQEVIKQLQEAKHIGC